MASAMGCITLGYRRGPVACVQFRVSYENVFFYFIDKYGQLFHRLFIGDRDKIAGNPGKVQTSYGKRTTTMEQTSKRASHTFSKLTLHVAKWFEYLAKRKEARLLSGPPPPPPTVPTLPPNTKDRYAISNMLQTDGIQLHVLAFDMRSCLPSGKSRAPIADITKALPSRKAMTSFFKGEYKNETVVVGVDPGEVVSASFCALDPKKPAQVTNLIVKRSALYSPVLAYRAALERMKQRRVCLPSVQDLHVGAWCSSDDIDMANWQVELPSIHELERPLPPRAFESIEKHESGLRDYHYVSEVLNGFYGSRTLKKMKWERQKAVRAEMDLAVHGALGMVNKHRPSLFVYGNAKFNTHTRLASLHESFKGYFFMKATSLGYNVVSADEYLTSSMCPSCIVNGHQEPRLAKPTGRSCVCLAAGCERWVHRDSIGAHNLALVGRSWLDNMTRPAALCRPS